MSHAHVTPVDITCVRHSHVHVTMCTSLTCTRHSHVHVTMCTSPCVRHSHVHVTHMYTSLTCTCHHVYVTMCTSLTCTRHSHVHVTHMYTSHVHVTCGHMLPALQALEKERDVAEDRLKIEQTQRDSIEKLRQRNKELEKQLRELCDSQVCMCVCLHV